MARPIHVYGVTEEVLDKAANELARRLIVLVYLKDRRDLMERPAGLYRDNALAGLKLRLYGELRNLSQ